MAQVGLELISKLREKTQAGVSDCKAALQEVGGDLNKAVEVLRKKGIALASKKSSRAAKEGVVESYIHMGGRIGVLVEVNCETDFVARGVEFKQFVKDVAMQIAASVPRYIKREDVPRADIDKESDILRSQITGKPPQVVEKILQGKLDKFYQEVCLLEQPFIKDANLTINDLLTTLIGKVGENIVIRRFARFQLGEEL